MRRWPDGAPPGTKITLDFGRKYGVTSGTISRAGGARLDPRTAGASRRYQA